MKPREWGEAEEADFQERAAILEFEAGMERAEAEHTARWMVAKASGAVPAKASKTRQAGTGATRTTGWLPGVGPGAGSAPEGKCGSRRNGGS